MSFSNTQLPTPRGHFDELKRLINNETPFTYLRFTDGELEIIRNQIFVIADGAVEWRRGKFNVGYPVYDSKTFLPERDAILRQAVIDSAKHRGLHYLKGIPTRSNNALSDKDLMIELNGSRLENLTFCDLITNENYRRFLSEIVPVLRSRENVFFVTNFRADIKGFCQYWEHVPIGDDIFSSYASTRREVESKLLDTPLGSTVLCSATSLTNVLGHSMHLIRPDITFMDVGTTLTKFIGLEKSVRAYHSQLEPWRLSTLKRKIAYYVLGSHRIVW